jgi:Flp pilus assembly protein TadG
MTATEYSTRVVSRSCKMKKRGNEESGYVAVVTALIVTVLLLCAGLAVDLASWYSRSTTLQRAADAAALAGVTAAPDQANEINVATESLAKNGLVNGQHGITATAVVETSTANQLRVTVSDSQVPSFFTRWFRKSPVLQRTAAAQYVQNISLGSSLNAIGTGDIKDMVPDKDPIKNKDGRQGFWLAVNGYCTAKEDGDRLLSSADGNRQHDSDVYVCNENSTSPVTGLPDHPDLSNAQKNADYDPAGYTYFVTVPNPGIGVSIQAFDPAYNPNPDDLVPDAYARIDTLTLPSPVHPNWTNTSVTTTYRIYPPDATPDNFVDDVPVAVRTFYTCLNPGVCGPVMDWENLYSIPPGSPAGQYRVQVDTLQNEPRSYGSNAFALRALIGTGKFKICSSIPGSSAFSASCPSVAGDESMSVYANSPSGEAEFYLAKLSPASVYRGKRVRILLWDPGEGATKIQIVPPTNLLGVASPAPFTYKTWAPGLTKLDAAQTPLVDKAEGWTAKITTDTLDTAYPIGDPEIPFRANGFPQWDDSSRYSWSKYNDRMIAIEITIPKNYGRNASGQPIPLPDDGWWKIRYISDSLSVTDRTTWSVSLAGDPVHLVDGND